MSFLEALQDRVLVCDGAMGSVLYDRGVFVNQSFEALNLTRPELVVEVHRTYVDAGADVIETNTFGANHLKLAEFGLGDQCAQINVAGVRLARQAAGAAGYVAGAIGPLGVKVGEGGGDTCGDGRVAFRRAGRRVARGGRRPPGARDLPDGRRARGRDPCRSRPDRLAGCCADGDG